MHQPGPGAAEPEQQVGIRIPAEGHHPVAWRQAAIQQHPGDAVGGQVEFGEAPGPLPEAQRRPVAEAGAARRTASPMVLRRICAPVSASGIGFPPYKPRENSAVQGGSEPISRLD